MEPRILGLHHVTATADDAQEDLDCYAGLLGLRLVKKTVNFDNHNVYHFYYGDEAGTPGTLWTTFPYKGWGVKKGTRGAGQITATSFSVPAGSLDAWRDRLDKVALWHQDAKPRFGDEVLNFEDPSGLVLELIASDRDDRRPWLGGGVDEDAAVQGVHSVTVTVRDAAPSVHFLTDALGWQVVGEEGFRTRLAAGGDLPGHYLDVFHDPDAPPAVNGTGTVHHVAMAIATEEEQLAARVHLLEVGRQVTEVRDRQYFRSIYFREPGGVLYEIATLGPGFTVDEPQAELGRGLKLPPWEEPVRGAIEAALPAVEY